MISGAALPDRVKREAIVGKLDRSFDLFGVHMGLKYKDVANPLKGGKLHIKVDDLQKIVKMAHSNKVEVDIEFDGGADTKDGIFKLLVNYLMVHSAGTEKGSLTLERSHVGGIWTTLLKPSAAPLGGKPIIPDAISNSEVKLESDRKNQVE